MADHMMSTRTPDEIMSDFDDGANGVADVDMRAVLWEVIDAVRDSYALALRSLGREGAALGTESTPMQLAPRTGGAVLHPMQIEEIEITVTDFVTNAFGDD